MPKQSDLFNNNKTPAVFGHRLKVTVPQETYEQIRQFYVDKGGCNWAYVSSNNKLFNNLWCEMLGLPQTGKPPPKKYR